MKFYNKKFFTDYKSHLKNFHFGIMASIPKPVNRKRLVTSV